MGKRGPPPRAENDVAKFPTTNQTVIDKFVAVKDGQILDNGHVPDENDISNSKENENGTFEMPGLLKKTPLKLQQLSLTKTTSPRKRGRPRKDKDEVPSNTPPLSPSPQPVPEENEDLEGEDLEEEENLEDEDIENVGDGAIESGEEGEDPLANDDFTEEENLLEEALTNMKVKPVDCTECGRMFVSHFQYMKHVKRCLEAGKPAVVMRLAGTEEPIIEERNEDLAASLDDQIKGKLMNKVDKLIIETTTEAGKCHCCGEDMATAHKGGEFTCEQCDKSFKLRTSLERHNKVVHHEGTSHECPECGARCADKGTLARHMYTHTGLKPYNCEVCNTKFSRKYHLDRHVLQTGCDGNPKPAHPCQVCGKMFSRKDNLREHLRAHAGQMKRKRKFACEFCGKDFQGVSLLAVHVRMHTGERPFKCDYCDKSFPSRGALCKHRRTHTGERPYECKECHARFTARETLNRHLKTHSGVKPHVCPYCGKGFIQQSQLKAHVFHHTGEYGYSCEFCGKAFNRRSRMMMHVDFIHKGKEPFQCTTCEKTFIRKEDLKRHEILHTGIKSHECAICQKSFSTKGAMRVHLLTHTKEAPKSCEECGRAFLRQDCLLRHMRKKHRDMLEEIMAEAEKKKLQQQLLAATASTDNTGALTESTLSDSIRELLQLLVDEATLKAFGFPDTPVDALLESVIRRCGHQPVNPEDYSYMGRLRENSKLLFTVVIDDSAVKTLLNNQTVDEVILHVLRLAKS